MDAASVSPHLRKLLRKLENKVDIAEARAARREIAKDGTILWDEVKATLDL
jgi:hypothetical protein